MAYSFDQREARSAKVTQYFEMLGNRAIWHDGWKAVTYHAPGSDFEDDRWELYHLEEDFSETRDLAAEHPEKLEKLVELWWTEAGRHNVLPLDDRIMERFLVPKPRPITSRDRFVYYAGAQVPSAAMPDIKNVSYSIRAEVDRRGDGVIVSCGDRFAGYALYVAHGHLVHDYNAAGTHHVVRSDAPVPEGRVTLEYRFRKTGDLQGIGELYVDDTEVGRGEVSGTLAFHISPTGITVGRSPVSAPSEGYEAPFPFTGAIHRVVFELGSDRSPSVPTSISALED